MERMVASKIKASMLSGLTSSDGLCEIENKYCYKTRSARFSSKHKDNMKTMNGSTFWHFDPQKYHSSVT